MMKHVSHLGVTHLTSNRIPAYVQKFGVILICGLLASTLVIPSTTIADDIPSKTRTVTDDTLTRSPAGPWLKPAPYTAKFKTVAHEILAIESEVLPVDDQHYRLLDSIIEEASKRIEPESGAKNLAGAKQHALKSLQTIDKMLTEFGFVYPGTGLVNNFSSSLTRRPIQGKELKSVLEQYYNSKRVPQITAHSKEGVYISDCDTLAFLYLAIGEVLKLPLAFVEVPRHNFVRWSFPNGEFIDWETMNGTTISRERVLRNGKFSEEELDRIARQGTFYVPFDHSKIVAYCKTIRGEIWRDKEEYAQAIADFRTAVQLNPAFAQARNLLAWQLVTCPEASLRDKEEGLKQAREAVRLYPRSDYLNTLAAAYAENGMFEKAVETEQDAISRLNDDVLLPSDMTALSDRKMKYEAYLEGYKNRYSISNWQANSPNRK